MFPLHKYGITLSLCKHIRRDVGHSAINLVLNTEGEFTKASPGVQLSNPEPSDRLPAHLPTDPLYL